MSATDDKEIVWTAQDPRKREADELIKVLRAEALSQAETPEELKECIMTLLTSRYSGQVPCGVTFLELNRRCGVVAHKLGTTCRRLIEELAREYKVTGKKVLNKLVLVPSAEHKAHLAKYGPGPKGENLERLGAMANEAQAVFERAVRTVTKD